MKAGESLLLDRKKDLPRLLETLTDAGYRVVGPTLREEAITYDDIRSVEDLPAGWTDEQDGGMYRLKRRGDDKLFGYVVGPHSWKKFLFPPRLRLLSAHREESGFSVQEEPIDDDPLAFLGVRSCELHAIAVQDKVLLPVDPYYRARRESLFLIAVNCGQAGGTCFCVSMNTGPGVTSGFDLSLTEIVDPGRHVFVLKIGSERGAEIARLLALEPATAEDLARAREETERAVGEMGRTLDTDGLKDVLSRNYEHPRWDEVAERCLLCANCTLVCPTCFCTTVEDTTDLTGEHAERWRTWDSCFTLDFSFIHGGSVRSSPRSRYRQWMTHKLSTWHEQFGTSGCVGCGRCITWCPEGIDITEEARVIRQSEGSDGDD